MLKWAPYPFLRITLISILGIIFGRYFQIELPLVIPIALSCGFALAHLFRNKCPKLLPSSLAWVALFCSFFYHFQTNQKQMEQHALPKLPNNSIYFAEIIQKPIKKKRISALAEFTRIYHNHNWIPTNTKVMLSFDTSNAIKYGDQFLISGTPKRIKKPHEPWAFNYQQFMAEKGVYYQHFINNQDFRSYTQDCKPSISNWAIQQQQNAIAILKKFLTNKETLAISQALTLGEKSQLQQTTRKLFSDVGIIHVLAVSGLHVGIIYLILQTIASILLNNRRAWAAIICLIGIWIYAAITGFSPSVSRSCLMFSFIIIAKGTKRQSHIINSIAASAWFLLVYQPNYLFDIGFQFSYLAVLGIILIQPIIANIYLPKNLVLSYFWGLFTVSIAAQLAVGGLSIYYFESFPTYFFVSNLVAVPIAFITLILNLMLILIGYLAQFWEMASWLGDKLAWLVEFILSGLIYFCEVIASWPMANLSISFDSWYTPLLIYVLLIGWISLCYLKRKWCLKLIVVSLFGLVVVNFLSFKSQTTNQMVICKAGILQIEDQTIRAVSLTNKKFPQETILKHYRCNHWHKINHSKLKEWNEIKFFTGQNQLFALSNKKLPKSIYHKPIDYILVNSPFEIEIEKLKWSKPETTFISLKHQKNRCRLLASRAKALNLKYHCIVEHGIITITKN